MSTSDTPLTDEAQFHITISQNPDDAGVYLVDADFARKLERENQEMRKLLAEWVSIEPDKCRSDHHGVCYEHSHFDLPCPVARARQIVSQNAFDSQRKKIDLLGGLISLVRESASGHWRVSLDYDNYHDGARVLDGDGKVLANCYESPPDEISGQWDGEEISAWQFEQAISRAIKSENATAQTLPPSTPQD